MNLSQYVGYPRRAEAAQAALGALMHRSTGRLLRKRMAPGVADLAAITDSLHGDAATLLANARWSAAPLRDGALGTLAAEHQALQAELQARYRGQQLPFPATWAVETETSFLLYALVRALEPATVIEMGVGNGQSSFFILRALAANGAGTLHSFDIAPQAGGLLSPSEREDWDFRLVDRWRSGQSLVDQLAALPKADICFHDADHGYLAQSFEFARLWEQLTDGGLLISDDVDLSFALIDFCAPDGKRPDILIDGRKAIGVLQRATAG